MLNVHVENLGDVTLVECEGKIVRRNAIFQLRNAVTAQADTHVVVLNLWEVRAIEGGGLGMLIFLGRWARDHKIAIKFFNPSGVVRNKLKRIGAMCEFEIVTLDEMMALLGRANSRYAMVA